jgi:hypothetical protein
MPESKENKIMMVDEKDVATGNAVMSLLLYYLLNLINSSIFGRRFQIALTKRLF